MTVFHYARHWPTTGAFAPRLTYHYRPLRCIRVMSGWSVSAQAVHPLPSSPTASSSEHVIPFERHTFKWRDVAIYCSCQDLFGRLVSNKKCLLSLLVWICLTALMSTRQCRHLPVRLVRKCYRCRSQDSVSASSSSSATRSEVATSRYLDVLWIWSS